jgi:hypothetical protein
MLYELRTNSLARAILLGLGGYLSFIPLPKTSSGPMDGSAAFLPSQSEAITPSSRRFLRYEEAQEIVASYRSSGIDLEEASSGALPSRAIENAAAWVEWIRAHDREIRTRIDRGVEDSISNLVLYGNSYTRLPRIENNNEAVTPEGELSKRARERVHALAMALGGVSTRGTTSKSAPGSLNGPAEPAGRRAVPVTVHPNERLIFVRQFLDRNGVEGKKIEPFLAANLLRFIREQREYQERLQAAAESNNQAEVLFNRESLFAKRGLSVDTSLLPNFALEDSLRALKDKGVLRPQSIRRIAVVGPGLDFADKREGYDFYPLQTLQPFAVLEAVVRLGLARSEAISVVTLDLNPFVNAHIKRLGTEAAAGYPYIIQLPRDAQAVWKPATLDYWRHFGDLLGSQVPALRPPSLLPGIAMRAVAIRPRHGQQVEPLDLDIVAETLDLSTGDGFDLVVATNVLVYYSHFEQSLALANIAHMMNPQGIFLANNVLPAPHPQDLEYLGRRSVSYSATGAYGDDVVVYRRKSSAGSPP